MSSELRCRLQALSLSRGRAVAAEAKTASKVVMSPWITDSRNRNRLGEELSARRSGDPERGLSLQFYRFRNPCGAAREERKTT